MVAQQLTPELTQPNVLVEIDHGPPMGLHQKHQQPALGIPQAQSPELMRLVEVTSVPRSSCLRPEPIACDVSRRTSCEHGGTASIKMEIVGTTEEALEDYIAISYAWGRPSWAQSSKSGLTVQDTSEEETAFVWMDPLMITNDSRHGADQLAMSKSSSLGWSPSEEGRQRTSFEAVHPDVPPLPCHAKAATGCWITAARMHHGSATKFWLPQGYQRSLLNPVDQRGALCREDALEDQSFNSDGNPNKGFVTNEKRMIETGKSSVFGNPKDSFHYDFPMRECRTGRLMDTESNRREDTDDVKSPSPMSEPNGLKTNSNVDVGVIARELFLWMIEYNLMTSYCEEHELLRLAYQSTELLLSLASSAFSCIHPLIESSVERAARVKQCTEKVHCLLDDPG